MLSEIGPPAMLASFNIPVVSALEGVGQNLWVSYRSEWYFPKVNNRARINRILESPIK